MGIEGGTRLVGLLGYPVDHSLSPRMHNHVFARLGLDLAYVPLPTPPGRLGEAVEALRVFGFAGANVTIPFKQQVAEYLDDTSELSKTIGAVNTIVNRGGRLEGTTTDPEGILRAIDEAGHTVEGKRVAVFGTGGTARSAGFAVCLLADPAKVYIVGRNAPRAGDLAAEIAGVTGKNVEAWSLTDYDAIRKRCDFLIHATSVGMVPHEEASLLRPEQLEGAQVLFDVVYRPRETALMRMARDRGLGVIGGLGMLVHQGIASFELWTQKRPSARLFYENLADRPRRG